MSICELTSQCPVGMKGFLELEMNAINEWNDFKNETLTP